MADNIKIVGNIVNTNITSRYLPEDINLIESRKLQEFFGGKEDYIEYYLYDAAGNLLAISYDYLSYKLPSSSNLKPGTQNPPNTTGNIQTNDVGIDSTLASTTSSLYPIIEIDPINDLKNSGYSSGEFQIKYNFFQKKISDPFEKGLFVKEISQDRTEIRLGSTVLTNEQIESGSLALINKINTSNYVVDYLLNFGNNQQYVAINVALNKNPGGYEILFKLYQPLPLTVQEKQTLWIVEEIVNPYNFDVNLDKIIIPPPPPTLRGPNFNVPIENQGTISTAYGSYSSLISNLQTLQSSSYNQIQSLLATQSIDINVDYTNFDDFIFFSSAKQRVINFYSKVKEIEDYQSFINQYNPFIATTASLQTTINQYSASISNIISNFDGYEYYLYFESSSYAWPKSSNNKPFILLSTGSATTLTWYHTLTGSAENYDETNYDNLIYAVPIFIKDDENNQPFLTFLNMVGHYFDNIWIYLKAVTDINLANNNLDYGISRDLVYQQLKSLGVKLYNSQAGNSVNGYLVGSNTGSSIFPYTPTVGNDFTITGSYLNNIPRADLVAELYKRIYHNLPLLLKTKGTVAGLDYLMTAFGIPNQTYYTLISGSLSSSFYTPTGSNSTASILNVKEFGGSLKKNLISGYNNDKVRIVSNVITGSVLSSELSLQTYPTASSAFRDDDLHYVDISFSPQNQINTYISGAIVSNNPTWSLDDYIGDPRQIYSGSYPDLDTQRKLYFETGVPGFAPFTASALDYNGFIRLIEFFDNSLFKMLNDFVPERTSLSTGITINSPVLERNKVVYSVPNAFTESIKNADYEIGEITPQYGQLYDILQGDKKPFFTGELSGSVVDVHQYFEDDFNPYDGDWNVWNAQRSISQSIDINKFYHSDWNVLLNNVSQSVTSSIRKNIEYIYGTTGSLTSSAQLQDSYLTLKSYNTSRYDGSKVTSLTYNTYTSGSYTGSDGRTVVTGDSSFGKTTAIDYNSYKVGWVKNIPSQSLNFANKTSINLKYLVDANNELTELSKGNLNLPEVQRIFQSGDPVILSISDVKKPSNQSTLDGTKTIWKGGFSYDPIVFREANETLYFRHDTPISSSIGYLGVKAYCDDDYGYFGDERVSTRNYLKAPPINPASNKINDGTNGSYVYYINKTDGSTTEGQVMSYRYFDDTTNALTNWTYRTSTNNKLNFNIPVGNIRSTVGNRYVYGFNLLNFKNTSRGYNTELNASTYSSVNGSNYLYKVPRTSTYALSASVPFSFWGNDESGRGRSGGGMAGFKALCLVQKTTTPSNENSWTTIPTLNPSDPLAVTTLNKISGPAGSSASSNALWYDDNWVGWNICTMDLKTTVSLTAGEYIRIQFYLIDTSNIMGLNGNGGKQFAFFINGGPLNTSVNKGYFEIYDQNSPITIYQFTSSYGQVPPLYTTSSILNNTLVFNQSASYLFTTASTFIPSSDSQKYYSPIVDYFGIKKYDLFRIGNFNSPVSSYYEVKNVSSSITNVFVTLDRTIETASYDNAQNFAIFRPKPDETSVIIDFKKQPGEVAQTILVPYNANDTIKNAVGNIFKTINPDVQ